MINQDVYLGFEEEARKLKVIVETTINNKLKELPLSLTLMMTSDCILSGSSISCMYHGQGIKDYDLWCKKPQDIDHIRNRIIQDYLNHVEEYTEKYKENVPENFTLNDPETGKKYLVTANAITLKNKIQLITLSNYESERKSFDFIHCMPYYDISNKKLHISPRQMDSIIKKKLVRNEGGKEPLQWRIDKFKNRGWSF
jgi:hypothetical protein